VIEFDVTVFDTALRALDPNRVGDESIDGADTKNTNASVEAELGSIRETQPKSLRDTSPRPLLYE